MRPTLFREFVSDFEVVKWGCFFWGTFDVGTPRRDYFFDNNNKSFNRYYTHG